MAWVVQAGGDETIHGLSGDIGMGLCSAPGGAFVTGYIYSEDALFGEGTANEISYPPPDEGLIFLARYDDHGTPAWVSRASARGVGGYSCAATADGGAVVTGFLDANLDWYGSMVFGAGEPGEVVVETSCDRSPFVAKYLDDGSLGWVVAADGPDGNGASFSASVAPGGDICIAGEVVRPFSFGTSDSAITISGAEGEGGGYLARFSSEGTPLWARELRGEDSNWCGKAAALEDGSCAVACFHCGSSILDGGNLPDAAIQLDQGNQSEGIPPECGSLVALYSPNGDLEWFSDLEPEAGARLVGAHGLAVDADSSILVGGSFFRDPADNADDPDSQADDPYLARLSPDGDQVWTALARGSDSSPCFDTDIRGVGVSPDGDIAVAGAFHGQVTFGPGEDNETTLESGDTEGANGFLALYSPDGILRWAIPVALGPLDDASCTDNWGLQEALGVSFSGPDALYVTGTFLDGATFGTSPDGMTSLHTFGCNDVFLMKLERVEEPR